MSEQVEGSSGWEWKGTITPQFVLALVVIAGPIIAGVVRLWGIPDTVASQGIEFKAQVGKLSEEVAGIRLDLAKRDGQAQQLADHETRLRLLENRGQ